MQTGSVFVSTEMQALFDRHKPLVLREDYFPATPEETLMTRMTAVRMLQSTDAEEVQRGKVFIAKTSLLTPADDLDRLSKLAKTVTAWNSVMLCSRNDKDYGPTPGRFLEYKLNVDKDNRPEVLHYHARYEPASASNRCGYLDQTGPLVRVIGDPILHKPGIPFPEDYTPAQYEKLKHQIEKVAKPVLIATSGAGIAANQCAGIDEPYAFAIVGVFHRDTMHTNGVEKRYSGIPFPEAMIMVNPRIVPTPADKDVPLKAFPHACLSVPGQNKCWVASPNKMTVEYQDYLDDMKLKQVTLEGTFAVVLWHELNHIVGAATYMDTALASLSADDLRTFEAAVDAELLRREAHPTCATYTIPPFHLSIVIPADAPTTPARLDVAALTKVLQEGLATETIEGFKKRIQALKDLHAKAAAGVSELRAARTISFEA